VWGFGGDSQWRENPVDGIASRKRGLRGMSVGLGSFATILLGPPIADI
jgi:hypothetical protein